MAKDDEKADEPKKGGKGKLIMMIVPVLLIAVGAVYFFVLKPSKADAAPKELPPPVAGAVVQLDPITVNLAGGHFLKLGMALQPTADAAGHGEVSGAKALDLAISEFSGMSLDDLSTAKGRDEAKAELVARVKLAYLPHDAEAAEEKAAEGKSEKSSESDDSEDSGESGSKHGDDSGKSDDAAHGSGHGSDAELTAAQAIKKANALTVQPDIYDIYFTEFVMQ